MKRKGGFVTRSLLPFPAPTGSNLFARPPNVIKLDSWGGGFIDLGLSEVEEPGEGVSAQDPEFEVGKSHEPSVLMYVSALVRLVLACFQSI